MSKYSPYLFQSPLKEETITKTKKTDKIKHLKDGGIEQSRTIVSKSISTNIKKPIIPKFDES